MSTTSSLPEYKYEPLDAKLDQIRVLQVLPQSDGEICLHLKVISISSLRQSWSPQEPAPPSRQLRHPIVAKPPPAPVYQCLSYCWGEEKPLTSICITNSNHSDGGKSLVRRNLHAFLQACIQRIQKYPLADHPWWWIDALCINQNDHRERKQQIQRMGDIYRHASGVHIWLGVEPGPESLLAKLANPHSKSCSHLHYETLPEGKPDRSTDPFYVKGRQSPEMLKFLADHRNDEILSICQFFLLNPYWQRLWIIQETALSKQLFLFTAQADFCHACIEMTTNFLKDLETNSRTMFEPGRWENLKQIFNMRHTIIDAGLKEGNVMPVGKLLAALIKLDPKCSEPRDQVYGIMAIGTFNTSSIEVDLQIDKWELFLQVIESDQDRSSAPLSFETCMCLASRLDIDLKSNFARYQKLTRSSKRILSFDIVFRSINMKDWIFDDHLKLEISKDLIKFGADQNILFSHSNNITKTSWIVVVACADDNRRFHALGLIYGIYKHDLLQSVSVEPEDFDVQYVHLQPGHISCKASRDFGRAYGLNQFAAMLECRFSEALLLKIMYWAADITNPRAQRLLGIRSHAVRRSKRLMERTCSGAEEHVREARSIESGAKKRKKS